MDKKRSSRNLKEKLKDVLQHQFKENLLLLCTIFDRKRERRKNKK